MGKNMEILPISYEGEITKNLILAQSCLQFKNFVLELKKDLLKIYLILEDKFLKQCRII